MMSEPIAWKSSLGPRSKSMKIKSTSTCISSRWAHASGRTQQSRELSFPPDHLGPDHPGTPPLEESHSKTSLMEKEEDATRKERSQQDAEGIFGTQKSEAIMSYLKIVNHNLSEIQPLAYLTKNTRHAAFVCLEEAVARHPIWMEMLMARPDALLAIALASLWVLSKNLGIRNLTPNGTVFSQAGQVPLAQLLQAERALLTALDWDVVSALRRRDVPFH